MANHKSAAKRARQSVKRQARNRTRLSAVRTAVKRVENAIIAKDAKAAAEALKTAQPALARGSQKGVLKRSTASRKLSRLVAGVKKLGQTK